MMKRLVGAESEEMSFEHWQVISAEAASQFGEDRNGCCYHHVRESCDVDRQAAEIEAIGTFNDPIVGLRDSLLNMSVMRSEVSRLLCVFYTHA